MKIVTLLKTNIALVAVFSFFCIFSLSLLVKYANEERIAIERQATFKQLGLDLSRASDDLTSWARAYVQYGEKQYYDLYMNEVNNVRTRENVVKRLKELGAPERELLLVQKAAELSNTLAELEGRAFEYVKKGDFETARSLLYGKEYEKGKAPIITIMEEFQKTMNNRAVAETQAALHNSKKFTIIAISVVIIMLIVVITSFIFIYRKIRTINNLINAVDDLNSGDGDLTKRIKVKSQDEFGTLAIKFNAFIARVREIVFEVKNSAGKVAEGNHQLTMAIDKLSAIFEEQAGQILTISKNIQDISSVSTSTVNQLAVNKKSITGAITKTDEGKMHLSVVIDTIGTVKDKTESLAETIKLLSDSVDRINDIILVINDIADQTNLLALNAAIEAARAGDAGRGFAVVADEVRKLAERTQSSTSEIKGIITSLHNVSARASNEMSGAVQSVGAAVDSAHTTNESFEEIISMVNAVDGSSDSISTGISQQFKLIQSNSEDMDNVANGVNKSNVAVVEVTQTVVQLENMSEQLKNLVNRFVI